MAIEAWPFLIGRSEKQDHRVVVAPSFMQNMKALSALRRATQGMIIADGTARRSEIHLGDMTVSLVFRTFMAPKSYYGLGGSDLLTDEFGRRILLTEGLILRGGTQQESRLALGDYDLELAHRAVTPDYQRFWQEQERFRIGTSEPIPARGRGDVIRLEAPTAEGHVERAEEPKAEHRQLQEQALEHNPERTGGVSTLGQLSDPEAPGPPAGPARWRKQIVAFALALIVIGGGAIGLLISSPWTPPSVLRPVGLAVAASGFTTLKLTWKGPATGPIPTQYVIVRDGRTIGSVPGSATSYLDDRLVPDTSYQYQVLAIRDGHPSPPSIDLTVRTETPPLSAATLSGTWLNPYEGVESSPSGTLPRGEKWTGSWTFIPRCADNTCGVFLSGTINGYHARSISFAVGLVRSGSVYSGHITDNIDECTYYGNLLGPMTSTLSVQVTITQANVQDDAWKATSWAGTLVISDSATTYHGYTCPAANVTATAGGSTNS